MQAGLRGAINATLMFCARQADAGDFMKEPKGRRLHLDTSRRGTASRQRKNQL